RFFSFCLFLLLPPSLTYTLSLRDALPIFFLKLESPGALAVLIDIHSRSVNHRQPQIRRRGRTLFNFDVLVALDGSGRSTDQNQRQVRMDMLIPVAHAAAVGIQHVIEYSAITFLNGLQFAQV